MGGGRGAQLCVGCKVRINTEAKSNFKVRSNTRAAMHGEGNGQVVMHDDEESNQVGGYDVDISYDIIGM
jgi:hypothetical protein